MVNSKSAAKGGVSARLPYKTPKLETIRMIRSQAVRDLVVAAVERLIACDHPVERRTGRVPCHCTKCGSVLLPEGLGWTQPTAIQSIAELIDAAREAEAELDKRQAATRSNTEPPISEQLRYRNRQRRKTMKKVVTITIEFDTDEYHECGNGDDDAIDLAIDMLAGNADLPDENIMFHCGNIAKDGSGRIHG